MNTIFLNRKEFIREFSVIALIILFPMSFIYHSLIALTSMPAFLGGYFSLICILLLPIYLFNIFFMKYELKKNEVIIFLLIILWFLFLTYQFVFSITPNNLELYVWGLTGLLNNTVCFLIASNIDLYSIKLRKYLLFFFFIISTIVFSNISNGQFYLSLKSGNDDVATYQSFGLYLLVISLILFLVIRSSLLKVIIVALSFLILYFNGSRSEFIFYIISILALNLINLKLSKLKIIVILCISTLLFLIYYNLGFSINIEENRIFQLSNISDSSSYLQRDIFNKNAIDSIKENLILGEYGQYVKNYGIGGYAHNILSAWVDFGILGFILFFGIPIYTLSISFIKIYSSKLPSLPVLALFLFSISLLIAYLFAKNYSYIFLGLVLGFYINYTNSNKLELKCYEN